MSQIIVNIDYFYYSFKLIALNFILFILDGDFGSLLGFRKYIDNTERVFVLLASQQIQHDSELNGVEFNYYSNGNVSILVSILIIFFLRNN